VVNERLASGVRNTLGARPESVSARCYGAAEDTVALAAFNDDLSVDDEDTLGES
jgi:hypothetical protein